MKFKQAIIELTRLEEIEDKIYLENPYLSYYFDELDCENEETINKINEYRRDIIKMMAANLHMHCEYIDPETRRIKK